VDSSSKSGNDPSTTLSRPPAESSSIDDTGTIPPDQSGGPRPA
jgi:hypothetical protein